MNILLIVGAAIAAFLFSRRSQAANVAPMPMGATAPTLAALAALPPGMSTGLTGTFLTAADTYGAGTKKCEACNGTGGYREDGPCGLCGGSGYLKTQGTRATPPAPTTVKAAGAALMSTAASNVLAMFPAVKPTVPPLAPTTVKAAGTALMTTAAARVLAMLPPNRPRTDPADMLRFQAKLKF
jgi:hypothetical protein